VWLSDDPHGPGSQFLSPAGIHLYPVLVRGVGSPGVFAWARDTREMSLVPGFVTPPLASGNDIARQRANAAAAAASGGFGFTDSRDIAVAVHTAVEDAANSYVLGFYPPEQALDNRFHALTVKVGNRGAARGRTLEMSYRPGYFAARAGAPAFMPTSVDSALRNPLDATGIGITALPGFSDGKPQVTLTVDLRDIHFDLRNNRHEAMLTLSFAEDSTRQIQTERFKLSFTDAEYATALEQGLTGTRILTQRSAVRIVARDEATGVAGSVRVLALEDQASGK
jgi:hypothetical protein